MSVTFSRSSANFKKITLWLFCGHNPEEMNTQHCTSNMSAKKDEASKKSAFLFGGQRFLVQENRGKCRGFMNSV